MTVCLGKKTDEQQEDEKLKDESFLRQMGYTQSLSCAFSLFMSFALVVNTVSVLISIRIGFTDTMNKGGAGVTIWSWIIGSVFTILISLSLDEMCSVYRVVGAVFHWYVYVCLV